MEWAHDKFMCYFSSIAKPKASSAHTVKAQPTAIAAREPRQQTQAKAKTQNNSIINKLSEPLGVGFRISTKMLAAAIGIEKQTAWQIKM